MRLRRFRAHNMGTLRDVDLDFESYGENVKLLALVGGNGTGKTTTLELALPGAAFRKCPSPGRSPSDLARSADSWFESHIVNGAPWVIRHTIDGIHKKSESSVFDADGKAVLEDTKVTTFARWAKQHLPNPDVYLASVFSAQKSEGLMFAEPAERRAVILRVLGVEKLEKQAEFARKQVTGVKAALETLRARTDDERKRGGDPEGIEREISTFEDAARGADEAVTTARGAVELAKSGAPALEVARREAAATRAKRADLGTRLAGKKTDLASVAEKLTNNRAVLADAEKIRAAEARCRELTEELSRIGADLKTAEANLQATTRARDEHGRTHGMLVARVEGAKNRALQAQYGLADREKIREAAGRVPSLETAAAEALQREIDAAMAMERVKAERLTGADERIAGLREGLETIAGGAAADPVITAWAAIRKDNEAVSAALGLPARLGLAEAEHAAAVKGTTALRIELSEAKTLAARQGEIDAAEREIRQAREDEGTLSADQEREAEALARAKADVSDYETAIAAARDRRGALEREQAPLALLAKRAAPLSNAEGRIAELEPLAEDLREEIAGLEEELAATPEPPAAPTPPNVADLEARLRAAETAARGATEAVTLARSRLERARESEAQIAALDLERLALEEKLVDWTKLATDLGKDGLQNAIIDAAGPEITAITNSLLHAAFGPRFTVRLETQKLTGDGRLVETFEIMVLDTLEGREAPAETYSGGESVILSESLSLALVTLACRQSGMERPTIVRDEAGAALDEENSPRWVAMLRRCGELIGVDRFLIVSHSQIVRDLCDARLQIGAAA